MIVPCECGAKLKLDDAKIGEREVRVRCPRCGNILTASKPTPPPEPPMNRADSRDATAAERQTSFPGRQQEPLILIAHDSDVVRDMVGGVLLDAGFRIEHAADGVEALEKASKQEPRVVIVDVGLPGIYGFELCERLKADSVTRTIKIILLASVYGITRYKRTPTSLYGADDYIEKHHIADSLVNKINTLLQSDGQETSSVRTHHHEWSAADGTAEDVKDESFRPASLALDEPGQTAQAGLSSISSGESLREASAHVAETLAKVSLDGPAITPDSFSLEQSIFEKEECDIPKVEETDPEAVEKAKRFARIIVSDIALYNQEAVIEGIKNGTFFKLLKDDIEEGRQLYEKRVPPAIRAKKDYYQETMDNFIAVQKKIVR